MGQALDLNTREHRMDYIANIINLPRALKKSGAWCKRTSTSFIAAVSQTLDPNKRTLEMDYIIYILATKNVNLYRKNWCRDVAKTLDLALDRECTVPIHAFTPRYSKHNLL